MLVEFRVKNFRSLRDEAVLSMEATHLVAKSPEVEAATTLVALDGRRLLKSAMILGANASGKSNVVRALSEFLGAIGQSATAESPMAALGQPFRLDQASVGEPTRVEVVAIVAGREHRYGAEVTADRVVREWLYDRPKKHERELFFREGAEIRLHKSWAEAQVLVPRTPTAALFLSVGAHFSHAPAMALRATLFTVSGMLGRAGLAAWSRLSAGASAGLPLVSALVSAADTGVRGLRVRAADGTVLAPETFEAFVAAGKAGFVVETFRDSAGADTPVIFRMDTDESDGTRRLFALAGLVAMDLADGGLCVLDELDMRLHPALSRKIVELFHDPTTNPRGAQLVFTAHDTNLLDPDLFRRDQVWFTEKRADGSTELYSLAEVRGVREAEAWERAYLGGRYGAVPVLNRFLDAARGHAS